MKNTLKVGMFVAATTLLVSAGAFAQDSTMNGGSTTNRSTTIRTENREEQNDYGWLGLLGLAGLAGLLKKPERHVVHQTDTVRSPNVGTGIGDNR